MNTIILEPGVTLKVKSGTSTDFHVTAHYAIKSDTGLTPKVAYVKGTAAANLDVLGAPSTGQQYLVKSVSVYNVGSSGNFDLLLVAGGVEYLMRRKASLAASTSWDAMSDAS